MYVLYIFIKIRTISDVSDLETGFGEEKGQQNMFATKNIYLVLTLST